MNSIILASASPRRKELLEQVEIPFEVMVSEVDENIDVKDPEEFVTLLSSRKALAVAEQSAKNQIILGADTVVVLDHEIMGKPADEAGAAEMLRKLQGNTHYVYTGITFVLPDGRKISEVERTAVHMNEMTEREILSYVATGEPMDKAGAYGIQGRSAIYIKGITGDYNNVVGLPVARVYQILRRINGE